MVASTAFASLNNKTVFCNYNYIKFKKSSDIIITPTNSERKNESP